MKNKSCSSDVSIAFSDSPLENWMQAYFKDKQVNRA